MWELRKEGGKEGEGRKEEGSSTGREMHGSSTCHQYKKRSTLHQYRFFSLPPHPTHPWQNCNGLPPSSTAGTCVRGIQAVIKSFVSNGAVPKSVWRRVESSPGRLTKRESWKMRTRGTPRSWAAIWAKVLEGKDETGGGHE